VVAAVPHNQEVLISDNSIFGNGGPSGNCGIDDQSDGPIDAPDNYWGSAAGPGVDPADAICVTNGAGSNTVGTVSTKERKPKTKAQR
jgi:hypothetical protein